MPVKKLKPLKLPSFSKLKPSTLVIMVYTNLKMNLQAIFDEIYVKKTSPVYTKRGNIDKKRIHATYGTIVSCYMGNNVRGLDLRKKKKKTASGYSGGTKLNYFRNTVTLEIAYNDRPNGTTILINVLIFKNCFKISGCKNVGNALEIIMILWETYLAPKSSMWELNEEFPFLEDGVTPNEEDKKIFITDIVMQNFDFRLGFDIDRSKLNRLMNQEEFRDWIQLSQFESTIHTNVNIKTYAKRPKVVRYEMLIYDKNSIRRKFTTTNPYNLKPQKKKNNTFTVFSTSETKISGRYRESIHADYDRFIKVINKYREEIREVYKGDV